MNVDFNNIRVQLAEQHNDLISSLNEHMSDDGIVQIATHEIDTTLENIRNLIVTLCCIYREGDPDCKSVIDEVESILDLKDPFENFIEG